MTNQTAGMPPLTDRLELYQQARQAASWGIGVSLGLGAFKLLGGLFGHSLALVSDAAHSLFDATISTALVGALLFAQRPADQEHPYGHSRFEAVAGAGVALMLICLALGITREAWITWNARWVAPASYTVIIGLAGSLVQEVLFRYSRRVATPDQLRRVARDRLGLSPRLAGWNRRGGWRRALALGWAAMGLGGSSRGIIRRRGGPLGGDALALE